jgi:hypothetical protein
VSTGSTGKFKGATGQLTINGNYNASTSSPSGTIKGASPNGASAHRHHRR